MKIIIATHGDLAISLKDTVQMIAGEEAIREVDTLCMTYDKEPMKFSEEARAILEKNENDDFLILTDLYGASPANTCISVFRNSDYRIVTGLNLGMLLETLSFKNELTLSDLSEKIQRVGKEGIREVYLRTSSI